MQFVLGRHLRNLLVALDRVTSHGPGRLTSRGPGRLTWL
jgi:hypothetical protein